MRHLDLTLLLVVVGGVALVHCQYNDYGQAPPRLLIPGAVPLGPSPGAPRRQSRLPGRRLPVESEPAPGPGPAPRLRSRPPARRLPLAPAPQPPLAPQFFSPAPPSLIQQRPVHHQEDTIAPRPVIEESDEDAFEDDFPSSAPFSPSPSPSTPPSPPPQPQRTVATFRPPFRPESRPALLPTPSPELNFVSPSRQQYQPRPAPAILRDEEDEEEEEELPRKPQQQTQYNRAEQPFNLRNKVRPTSPPEEQQYSRQSQQQFNRAQNTVRAQQKPVYSSGKQQDYEKPLRQHQRQRKPVAQVLRKYRDENEDGSITWGYENDDGSFKEETIGTDCVTYGKYGYVDPDGNRREYSYSTGVPCDKNRTDNEQAAGEGYVDYAENKYVLPNGDSIDLDKMVKNRARKPVSVNQYRN